MNKFAHLHLYTEYSFWKSAVKVKELFAACEKKGISSVAITDSGNMYGVIEFLKAAVRYTDSNADFYTFMEEKRAFKVKPIIGCELRLADESGHIVLLCKNEQGYHNLIKLASKSSTSKGENHNRIDFNTIEKHCNGLICLYGDVKHYEQVKQLKCVFGDDLYIEIQNHGSEKDKTNVLKAAQTAKELDIKLVATNDVRYIEKEDSEIYKVITEMKKGNSVNRFDNNTEPISDEYFLKSYDEMQAVLPDFQEALDNTIKIANKCDPYVIRKERLLPKYPVPHGQSSEQYLRMLTEQGLERRYGTITDEIKARADHELSVICQKNCADYFLIVWDYVSHANAIGIPVGSGRGSVGGSIVAYALEITQIDPIKNGLIFERFLNPEREMLPDIDLDFCINNRKHVVEYICEKYGIDNTSNVVTIGTYNARTAVTDVCRVYGLPYEEAQRICSLISPASRLLRIKDLLNKDIGYDGCLITGDEDLIDEYENNAIAKKVLDVAARIEGMPYRTGCHAAKHWICKDAITDHIPLALSDEGELVTQYDMCTCEELGLVGFDLLGLNSLTDIKSTFDEIKTKYGKELDFTKCSYDDPKVYEYISTGKTDGVFQLESSGMKHESRSIKPTKIEELVAIIALYRPGMISSLAGYKNNRKNANYEYLHKNLAPILSETHGILVYQEQVIQIFHDLAGFSYGEADNIRRILSKKKRSETETVKNVFIHGNDKVKGCVNNGISEDVARSIFEWVELCAPYTFLKAHAVGYAQLTYQTAYLNFYYPSEYWASILNNRKVMQADYSYYKQHVKNVGITVLPVDINKSSEKYTVDGDSIRMGFNTIKGISTTEILRIVAERRDNGTYKDFNDFLLRTFALSKDNIPHIKEWNIREMISAGAFDCFGVSKQKLVAQCKRFFKEKLTELPF